MSLPHKTPTLYVSLPYPCSYLPERQATTLFIDPHHPIDRTTYDRLTRQGFRRSGNLVYRPHCQHCSACISIRVPVERFRPSRGQRRTWRRNADLEVRECPAQFVPEHFELYRRYQSVRHAGSTMDSADPQLYTDFLISRFADTRFYEFRRAARTGRGELLAVAVVDVLADGLSAVYTFFEPSARPRGLGVHAVLWQIEQARRLDLPWVYLGYWIDGCRKMAYKADFRPFQVYRDRRWSTVADRHGFTPD